jgi:epoxyqueuosine reductase
MDQRIGVLTDKLKGWGATKVGFSYVAGIVPDELKRLTGAITIVIRLSDEIIDQIDDRPTHTYFHHYRTVNMLIDQITLRCTLMLQEWGHRALAIPASQTVKTETEKYSGVFQHKTAATMAGIGWIGKSGLLITPEYGPRVRLGTVLTDMGLPYGRPITESRCGDCRVCVSNCPASALHGTLWTQGTARKEIVDAHACSTFMHDNYRHIGRGSVCGICIQSCPTGSERIR